jgi:hypothetical protein
MGLPDLRPRWRATRAERRGALPGDEIVGRPRYRTTRAVTIDAAVEEVWPWLVQLGQGRGGMYSYDRLENLFGLQMHSADRIDPALQDLAVGDVVRMVPEGTEPDLSFVVARLLAPHELVLASPETRERALASGLPFPAWTFALRRAGRDRTRLVVRFQSDFTPSVRGHLLNHYALAPVHFVMERKMLLGIKERAERHH